MEFIIGGLAATTAGILTNPLEVVKHHMEIGEKIQFTNKYRSFFHTGFQVAKNEGFKSLQKGLSPALGAHLICYGMKLGSYQFGVNKGFTKDSKGRTLVLNSVATSALGGLLGQYMSSPFYLLKAEHHHADEGDKIKRTYSDTAKKIFREYGIKGLFRGATASLPRAFIGTSQLTSFAITKETLNNYELFLRHPLYGTILAGTVAGIVLSMAMTPFETVLTSMYKQAIRPKTHKTYLGYIDCMRKIYKKDGFKPFYRGLGPVYLKLGPHTALCLVFWEELTTAYEKYNKEENNKELGAYKLDLYNSLGFDAKSDFNSEVDKHEDNATMLYL